MASSNDSVRFFKGTNVRVQRTCYDQYTGDPIDLTGYSIIKLQVSTATGTATASLTFNVTCGVDGDPSGGVVYADFVPADTSSKTAQLYIACIKITYGSGVVRKSDPFDFHLFESVEAAA